MKSFLGRLWEGFWDGFGDDFGVWCGLEYQKWRQERRKSATGKGRQKKKPTRGRMRDQDTVLQ